ncbi:hypothetical protein HK102_002034 [Quaeritorhiza haematococci]|nr:hypothetical protein HK102_002034 [Quaeritorhiza haematococci]
MSFQQLPSGLLIDILALLPPDLPSLWRLRSVSRSWNEVIVPALLAHLKRGKLGEPDFWKQNPFLHDPIPSHETRHKDSSLGGVELATRWCRDRYTVQITPAKQRSSVASTVVLVPSTAESKRSVGVNGVVVDGGLNSVMVFGPPAHSSDEEKLLLSQTSGLGVEASDAEIGRAQVPMTSKYYPGYYLIVKEEAEMTSQDFFEVNITFADWGRAPQVEPNFTEPTQSAFDRFHRSFQPEFERLYALDLRVGEHYTGDDEFLVKYVVEERPARDKAASKTEQQSSGTGSDRVGGEATGGRTELLITFEYLKATLAWVFKSTVPSQKPPPARIYGETLAHLLSTGSNQGFSSSSAASASTQDPQDTTNDIPAFVCPYTEKVLRYLDIKSTRKRRYSWLYPNRQLAKGSKGSQAAVVDPEDVHDARTLISDLRMDWVMFQQTMDLTVQTARKPRSAVLAANETASAVTGESSASSPSHSTNASKEICDSAAGPIKDDVFFYTYKRWALERDLLAREVSPDIIWKYTFAKTWLRSMTVAADKSVEEQADRLAAAEQSLQTRSLTTFPSPTQPPSSSRSRFGSSRSVTTSGNGFDYLNQLLSNLYGWSLGS